MQRDCAGASQRKGYTHSFTPLISRREESIQIKFTDDKRRTASNDKHEEIVLVNCVHLTQNTH